MFNPTALVIDAFVEELKQAYTAAYANGETIGLPTGATDASLAPYHVERGKLFVRERFSKNRTIDVDIVCANIEYTRFPVPADNERRAESEYPALLRASDLIGQLADLNYMRKGPALFMEFAETGVDK